MEVRSMEHRYVYVGLGSRVSVIVSATERPGEGGNDGQDHARPYRDVDSEVITALVLQLSLEMGERSAVERVLFLNSLEDELRRQHGW
jgi:hypothetical protein